MNTKLGVEPIRLLAGSHPDTATTGQGCVMNVISYLNGEAQITDNSPCVHPHVREVMIAVNDGLPTEDRQALIQFIPRAMGSAVRDSDDDRKVRTHALLRMIEQMLGAATRVLHVMSLDGHTNVRAAMHLWPVFCAHVKGDGYQRAVEVGTTMLVALLHSRGGVDGQLQVRTRVVEDFDDFAMLPPTYTYRRYDHAVFDALMTGLDAFLPPADEPTAAVVERAVDLVKIFNAAQHAV